jgi:hypothetical protein
MHLFCSYTVSSVVKLIQNGSLLPPEAFMSISGILFEFLVMEFYLYRMD